MALGQIWLKRGKEEDASSASREADQERSGLLTPLQTLAASAACLLTKDVPKQSTVVFQVSEMEFNLDCISSL